MTSTAPKASHRAEDSDGLVEMSWDPITRIVGPLGIYTKIDFKQKVVAECVIAPHRSSAAIPSS